MRLRLRILGSGTIIPRADRRSPAILVEAGESWLLDCGPDAPQALAECGIRYGALRRIFLTHLHPDHSLGLGRLLAARRNDRDERPFPALYGPRGLDDLVAGWGTLYPGARLRGAPPATRELEPGEEIEAGDARIRCAAAEHGDAPALSYRLERGGASIVYTGDTEFTEPVVELAAGADLLVAECSAPDDAPLAGHLTPSSLAALARETGVKRLLATHLYPAMENVDIAGRVGAVWDGRIEVARDGTVVEL